MKKLMLIAFLALFVSATTTPTLTRVLGFASGHAYAADDDSQGDNDLQGEDLDGQ